jgi:hypothetical protein
MSIDSGWWAGLFGVVGAAVGGLASLGGTVLNDYLSRRSARELDRIREATLRKRFAASNREWIPIKKLMDCVGADRETTIRHLLMIGARRSMAENDSWGLKDWPEPSN